jgi:ABC-type uncharacterized transport system ATPase subunit
MKIELQHIHKRFGSVHANNDITLTFEEGHIVGVLGENGAGKSTLMKILSGYQPADNGNILLDGVRVNYDNPRTAIQYGVGMLQQDPLDIGAFTVIENFLFQMRGTGILPNWRSARRKILEANARFGFELDPDAPAERLSVAQRQQLEIVRLLALGVRTLILDEPTTGISEQQKGALFNALKDLATQDRMTVLLVSHKLEDVIALCDEVVVLRAGCLVGQRNMPATPKELVSLMFGAEIPPPKRERVQLGDSAFHVQEVNLTDGRLHMNNLNLDLRAGEVIGLAGLEGSGQELFMRACAGLHKVQSGKIRLHDKNLTGHSYRRHMDEGIIFAASGRLEEGLIAGMTLTEHSALMMDNGMRINWGGAETQMQSQIAHYRIRGNSDDNIEQLSGGNQQRVLMALLPPAPSVLILEQPTRGLDVESAQWIWEQLLARRENGTAIIFSSPELDEILTYSDRILVFYAGHVIEIPDAHQTNLDELGHLIGGEFERQ